MPRPIWSGAVSFGLVNVPVKLFSAISHQEVRFNQLHKKDGGRIHYKRVCSVDGEEVPYEDIIKGYETSPDQYVTVEPEELEKLDPKASRTIEIEDFVRASEVDPIYFEHPYFLAPDKGAQKPYALLTAAMDEAQKVAVAKMVLRTRQYLCLLRPYGRGLALTTLNYADEVNDIEQLGLPDQDATPKERELTMAKQLVDALTAKFDPQKYRDDYRARVLQVIQKKAEGEQLMAVSEAPKPTRAADLMDALQASLAMGPRAFRGPERRGERRQRTTAARTRTVPKSSKR